MLNESTMIGYAHLSPSFISETIERISIILGTSGLKETLSTNFIFFRIGSIKPIIYVKLKQDLITVPYLHVKIHLKKEKCNSLPF